eukprot:CAMPEP_0170547370 /NCGR_PEP_ID=MMETSP0211-20121228/5765_1 /TAXON_ID=311385 /ORGANISM="Pseudokeronopsis sp., Strain OXSARD2" /LENGTH=93 /DNA_ID=CAMNT_0010852379 /DNA_START=1081 /DNA_END=1362 /DNA_ORIENTATION=-
MKDDADMKMCSDHINTLLLLKQSDPFIKKKFQAYLEQKNKSEDKPDFFKRMEVDQKKRNLMLNVISKAQDQGHSQKLLKLKKLTKLAHLGFND